jgi:hypothetical protein
MTTQTGFAAGVQFAVQALRKRAAAASFATIENVFLNMADHLEAQASGEDAPKVLVLPLQWEGPDGEGANLYGGGLYVGRVYRIVDAWLAAAPGSPLRPGHLSTHPTLSAAKSALETAVMALADQP